MSPTPQELLSKYGLRPKHSWGQNFLGDARILEQIAAAARVGPEDTVVELGPGLGHLTRALLARGPRVIAVERDRDMVRVLEDQRLERLEVVSGNAATVELKAVAGISPVTVVGNLPYHLTAPILFGILEQHADVRRAVLTLQQEVVTRLTASPGGRDYGLLTVLLGLHFDVEELFSLPAALFHPPPKVDSAVVRLEVLPAPRAAVRDEARFKRLVKAAFGQRRKTLWNSLRSDPSLGEDELVARALQVASVERTRRAETLCVEEFAAIERALDA